MEQPILLPLNEFTEENLNEKDDVFANISIKLHSFVFYSSRDEHRIADK